MKSPSDVSGVGLEVRVELTRLENKIAVLKKEASQKSLSQVAILSLVLAVCNISFLVFWHYQSSSHDSHHYSVAVVSSPEVKRENIQSYSTIGAVVGGAGAATIRLMTLV